MEEAAYEAGSAAATRVRRLREGEVRKGRDEVRVCGLDMMQATAAAVAISTGAATSSAVIVGCCTFVSSELLPGACLASGVEWTRC